jgi:hypothetical protein
MRFRPCRELTACLTVSGLNRIRGATRMRAAAISVRTGFMLIHFPVDRRHLFNPTAPIGMLETHDVIVLPVKVVSEKGYLPVKLLQGVAHYPPRAATSVRNSCWHCGHVAGIVDASNRFHSL